MKPTIHSRLPDAGTTIFTKMSVLAQQYKAINLGQGFPDYPMDSRLIDAVSAAMVAGHNQYVHMNGLLTLRERIAEKAETLYGQPVNPDTEITITPGGTYAIYTALTAILQPGDEVIIFEPAYDSYLHNITINGAVPVRIPLMFPGYDIDWEKVLTAITPRTKAIIINSPHNPSGRVLTPADIGSLQKIVKDTGIFIISDEVYEHLIFDGLPHLSMLRYPELKERSFTCFSFGKVYHCTGWKMGYCIAPAAYMAEFRKVHQFNCFTCNSPIQYALADFLSNADAYLNLGADMQKRRDFLGDKMKGSPFEPLPSSGSYFQVYSYAGISDLPELEFAEWLTREVSVTTIPVSAFYKDATNNQVLRFCFAKNEETLSRAAERLVNFKF
ncbi:MAG: methionine aminotransferase [Ferruginibacter sp.]